MPIQINFIQLRLTVPFVMRALVTGGTGRVGSAIAERLDRDRWDVFAAGGSDGDLSNAEAARAVVRAAAERLGGLDLLVNAASEGFAPMPVEDVDEAAWDAAIGATAKGSFFVTQAAAPLLRESRGVVVMIEDVPRPAVALVRAALRREGGAQAMLTRVFARALAPEVRVCGIAPGPVAVEPEQVERRAAETLLGRIGTRRRCGRRGHLPRRRRLRHRDDARGRRRPAAQSRRAPLS